MLMFVRVCSLATAGRMRMAEDTDGLLSTDLDTDIGTDADSHISLDGRAVGLAPSETAAGDALDLPPVQHTPGRQLDTADASVPATVADISTAEEVDDSIVSL